MGLLGFSTFHFFGPLASEKIDDPYDMTEAFEEFQFRAEIGRALALKDKNDDGIVKLQEFKTRQSVVGEKVNGKDPQAKGVDGEFDVVGNRNDTGDDSALLKMQSFLQSIDPALTQYAASFVGDYLTPELLRHLPWASYGSDYGVPNGHIAFIQAHFANNK